MAEPTIDFALAQLQRRLLRAKGVEVTTGGRTLTARFRADDGRWYAVHLAAGAVVADGEPVDDGAPESDVFDVPEIDFAPAAAIPRASAPPVVVAPAPPPAVYAADPPPAPRPGVLDIVLTTLAVASQLDGEAHDAVIVAGAAAAIEELNR